MRYGDGGNKDKKTKWLATVNEKRNIVSHASSGITLSLEELAELQDYEQWLSGKVAGAGAQTESAIVGSEPEENEAS
jgi:hypothetical protein